MNKYNILKFYFQGPPGEPGERGSPGRPGDMVPTHLLPHSRENDNVFYMYLGFWFRMHMLMKNAIQISFKII